MKALMLAAIIALSLGLGVAKADPVSQTAPQHNTDQYDLTAGAAGWG